MKRSILYLSLLVAAITACDRGSLKQNAAPDTRISVTEINLVGEERLRSEVTLHWLGTDVDGYVTSYELSLDGTNWTEVTSTDSTFNFSLTAGSDTTDIDFFVRAIDNDGARDETPAYLLVPIKNSPPTAIFDTVRTLPDTGFVVMTIFFDVDDSDGANNLDSVFLKLNNGPWYPFEPTVNTVTLVPQDPAFTGITSANVFVGPQADLLPNAIAGLNLEGDNTFYLKARDAAGAESVVDTSRALFYKRKTSDLLLVDAHNSGSTPTPEEVYDQALSPLFASYDRIDLTRDNGANIPQLWIPTFSFLLELYDKVFWYGSTAEVSILENAAAAVQNYLTGGGKVLISTSFPTDFDNSSSAITEFTPIDSAFVGLGPRLPLDSLLMPTAAFAADYDTLEASIFVGRATPIYVKSIAETIYNGQIFAPASYNGPTAMGALTRNGSGNINMVIVSVELQQVYARPQELENFFNQVLLNEFNW
ncbi:MAG: discoidin domain-containing protein [Bacteroidota bacterium]